MNRSTLFLLVTNTAIAASYLPTCTHNRQIQRSLAFVPKVHTPPARPIHHRTPTRLFAKSEDIQNIYKQVQEEDSEWFNSLSKLLGEAGDIDADEDDLEREELDVTGKQANGETSGEAAAANPKETINQSTFTAIEEDVVMDGSKMQTAEEESQVDMIQQSKSTKSPIDESSINSKRGDDGADDENSTSRQPPKREASTTPNQLVQLRNKYTDERETVAPLSYFLERGYSQEEVLSLRPQVLELIVEDDIPKPRRGVPDRWVRDSKEDLEEEDVEWIIEVIGGVASVVPGKDERVGATKATAPEMDQTTEAKSPSSFAKNVVSESWGPFSSSRVVDDEEEERQSTLNSNGKVATNKQRRDVTNAADVGTQNDRDYDESEARQRQEMRMDDESAPRRNRRSSSRGSYDRDEERPRSRRSRRQSTDQRSRPRPRKRELVIDRGDDDSDDPPPNKFWMDLPTFRDFLRTEARLRLKILGPDWKDSVLDESRWRFDLYKRWLYLLNDGVGENPLYTYGDRPRQPRRPRGMRRDSDFEDRRRRSERDRARGSYSADNADDREPGRRDRRDRRHRVDNDIEEPRQPSRREVKDEEISTKATDDSVGDDEEDKHSSNQTEIQHKRSTDVQGSVRANFRDRGDEQTERDQEEPGRRQRGESNINSPRRRNRPTADWKDFGDLEDQLLNGSRDDTYRDERSSSRRRRRARMTDQFDEDY